MAIQDNYTLLSTAVRIANAATLSPAIRLKSLARFIKKSFHLQSVVIYMLDMERRNLVRRLSDTGPGKGQSCALPIGEGPAGRCALRKEAVISEAGPDAAGTLYLPLICGKRLAGVMALQAMTGTPCPEGIPEVLQDILTEVAGQLWALEISARSDRRIQQLITFEELAKILQQPVPFNELLPFVLKAAHAFGASSCTVLRIFHYDVFSSKIVKRCDRKYRPQLHSLLAMERECSSRMLAAGTPLLATDVIAEEDLPPSYVCVPLRFEEQTFGTVTFFGKVEQGGVRRNFDEEDRDLFAGMANLIAGALVGVQNYRRMTALATENVNRLKKLSLLYRISNIMHSTTRINKLIHLGLTALTSGLPPLFERAMLFLVNKRSGVMQGMFGVCAEPHMAMQAVDSADDLFLARWRIGDGEMERLQQSDFSRMVKGTRIPLDKSRDVLSQAVLDRRIILVNSSTRRKTVLGEMLDRYRLSSFAAVPLIAKNEAIALIVIDNPQSGRSLGRDDQRLLQLFANQAGMAIENAMLYNRIEDADRQAVEIRQRLMQGERLAALGETAASIAHELKGPLVAIGGLARRLLRTQEEGTSHWRYADTITREAARLETMLAEILFFTKKATICYAPCRMEEVIEDSLAVVSDFLEERGVTVRQRISGKPLELLADCRQLTQVCINLFRNAGEAMKMGGELVIAASPAALDQHPALSLRVRDTGGGIPPEQLPRIFEPFFTTKASGTGLGLAISQRIITNHGGKIVLENRPGIGAEFRILLPVHP
jgi:two-component system, NtrC family, sensor histidine kinase HydH